MAIPPPKGPDGNGRSLWNDRSLMDAPNANVSTRLFLTFSKSILEPPVSKKGDPALKPVVHKYRFAASLAALGALAALAALAETTFSRWVPRPGSRAGNQDDVRMAPQTPSN